MVSYQSFIWLQTSVRLKLILKIPVIRPQPKYGSCGTSLNESMLNRIDSFPLVFIALSFNSRKIGDVFVTWSFQLMFVSSDCPAAAWSASPLEELAVFTQRYWNGAGWKSAEKYSPTRILQPQISANLWACGSRSTSFAGTLVPPPVWLH